MRAAFQGFLIGAAFTLSSTGFASVCFRLPLTQNPQTIDSHGHASHGHTDPAEERFETWCYEKTNDATFIFNMDNGPRADHSAYVRQNRATGRSLVTYGMHSFGELRILSTDEFNPLSIPLDAKEAAETGLAVTVNLSPEELHSANQVAELLAKVSVEFTPVLTTIQEGIYEGNLPEDKQPFVGYWWPSAKLELAMGPYSPMGKFDSYMQSLSGTYPNSAAWEIDNHKGSNVPWSGHCNGWAASTVLFKQPTSSLWDPSSRKVFFPSDIKGLMAEASYCVHYYFYGTRYKGPGDNLLDIDPVKFHKVLRHYIDKEVAILYDYNADERIDNNVITGYRININQIGTREYDVEARLRAFDYELKRTEKSTNAKEYERTYRYRLTVNSAGDPVSGVWLGENPDFFWVPTGHRQCSGENPAVSADLIERLQSELPIATNQTKNLNFALNRRMRPYEELNIPVNGPIYGANFKINVDRNSLGHNISLLVKGYAFYPTDANQGIQTYEIALEHANSLFTYNAVMNTIVELKLRNNVGLYSWNGTLRLSSIDYLGGN